VDESNQFEELKIKSIDEFLDYALRGTIN